MQKAGIFPDAFLILNMENNKMETYCDEKFKANEKILEKNVLSDKNKFVKNHCL